MIPTAPSAILSSVTVIRPTSLPTRTYRVDYGAGRIRGMVDRREAMVQAVRKILATQRFEHLIYSWNYGTEWDALFGKSRQVVESELERVLAEALKQDDRVTGVSVTFIKWTGRNCCDVAVTVETIFGTIQEEATVRA